MYRLALGVLLITSGFATAAEPMVKNDIVYATVGGEKLQLDLMAPKSDSPLPCVVLLHGGAWKSGSRKDLSRPSWYDTGERGKSLLDVFAARGFIAVSVSYRLVPKDRFPAQIQDVRTAIRFLRLNAKEYNIDPDRIGILGFSSGGHLAALAGTAAKDLDGPLYPEQSSRVQCVVDFFGPADLSLYSETPGVEKAAIVPLLGATSKQNPAIFKKASPLEHVTKDAPPFLILHGTADIIVPMIHSERLHAKLKEAGVESELFVFKGRGHGWDGEDSLTTSAVAAKFLNTHLGKAK